MINVEVATILHFTQVIYQITRHSVLSDIYIWNIVSWQLKHIHSRLNTFHLKGKVNFNEHYSIICLFVCFLFRDVSLFQFKRVPHDLHMHCRVPPILVNIMIFSLNF